MIYSLYDICDLSNQQYSHCLSLMSEEKRERIHSMRFEDDKKRSVVGEMLARTLISKECHIKPEDVVISRTEYGKPYIKNLNIEFNISHSYNMVACAIDKRPVGIDIEKIRPLNLAISKYFCNADDMLYIFDHIPRIEDFYYTENIEILKRFFEVWTKKEAYGKCMGTGIINAKKIPIVDTNIFEWVNDYALAIKRTVI